MLKRTIRFFTLFIIVLTMIGGAPQVLVTNAQTIPEEQSPEQKARELLNGMTPAEKVGQLFLVSFEGREISSNSQIFDLIINNHIGGVILLASNDNFTSLEDTIPSAYQMISSLQQMEWLGANPENEAVPKLNITTSHYIPLFIAISQEGDGYPNSQILSGLTPLPNQMAIGATWSPQLAHSVGEILGKELSALGINLLLGPSLDVLDMTYSEGKEGLGTRTFGSNPYWVGQFGSSYIEGVHTGSDHRMIVISKHFPGSGSSDRDPTIDVATVRKSYDVLMENDLAPFFAVTGNASSKDAETDGLLISHIRYEGLQGTIRTSTRPISFDASALEQLLGLPALSVWRQDGGILVSDNLGSQAVRKYYDPNNTIFDARQVARNAINAGADLLYLDKFIATGDYDQYTTIKRTLEFFIQKYLEDEAFAQRVDSSVIRLLTLKYRLYSNFDLQNVIPPEENLEFLNQSNPTVFEIAQRGITLLSPPLTELGNVLPNPPGLSDRTIFFTDLEMYKQCSDCPEIEMISTDALRKTVVRLYGPEAGGNIQQYLVSTFSFVDLMNLLDGLEGSQVVEEELKAADWVVFAILDPDPTRPASMALKRLLSERSELLANKYSLAFAFNAPYYLDATEISNLTAYFAVYSKTSAFTEIAARVLFQEIVPTGALPISLPAVGYDLSQVLSPEPSQNISISLDTSSPVNTENLTPVPTAEGTLEPTQIPSFKTGDTLPLVTGLIYDHNHNPVPDGTIVKFIFSLEGASNSVQQIETQTISGVARSEYIIQNEGKLEIRVTSGAAINSDRLILNITKGAAAVITVIAPTPTSTQTPQPSPTIPSPTPTTTITPTLIPPEPVKTSSGDWLLSMLIIFGLSTGIFTMTKSKLSIQWGIRCSLLAAIGGMMAYSYLSLDFQANHIYLEKTGFLGIVIVLLIGLGIGWLIGWFWYRNFRSRGNKT